MNSISKKIENIGKKLVKCSINCNGITNKPNLGVIPRCLFYEDKNRTESKGCVVVGINPGKSIKNKTELNFYKKNGISYSTICNFWIEHGNKYGYYSYLRDFIKCAGYTGPILWTELAKCETDKNLKFPPLQTFRICTSKYLNKELKLIPSDWPLLAVGREAHKALSYLYPKRQVIGIPHPTSSRGHFSKLFTNKKRSSFKNHIQTQLNNIRNTTEEIWLS